MPPTVDQYLAAGCGRCPLGGTPDCKVHTWTTELEQLRRIVLACGLTEVVKWGVPCYMFQGKNVLLVSALKDYCAMSFFKGALLEDTHHMLEKPGPNSQAVRLLKFTDSTRIYQHEHEIKAYVFQAIEVEKAGLTIDFQQIPEPIPEELEQKFEADPVLKTAFEALTPGRQRGYILHFSQPKQSKTRIARIDKHTPNILSGIGLHDTYKGHKRED